MKNLITFFFILVSLSLFSQNNEGKTIEIVNNIGTYTAEITKPNGQIFTVKNVTVKEGKTIFVFSTPQILAVSKKDVSFVRSTFSGKNGQNSISLPQKIVISNNSIFVMLIKNVN